ncbi:MAG TPA: AMP-binding protein, partial [Ktedonobacterales bacterium]|nr:AMP-binding protein [Ktedonobacterales bacterium]
EGLIVAIKALSHREGGTVYTTLLATMYALFCRYTSQEEMLIGTPVAGRDHIEVEHLLGAFINSVTMRGDLSGDPTFLELLGQVQRETRVALAHQDLPFDMVVQRLQPERIAGQNPLFQVMLAYWESADLPHGWRPALTLLPSATAKFDLTLTVNDYHKHCDCVCEYSTDLYNESTIARMMGHWLTLLESAIAEPEQHITALPLLSESERHLLLDEWNATARPFAPARCAHHLFEEQVERVPDNIALVYETESLTYAELNRRANQLAHYLLQLGVGPETLVGLCVDRSLDMIVAILGIFKAGGAYVPLDSAFPPARIAAMLQDAQIQVAITQRHLTLLLPQSGVQIVAIDADWGAISHNPDHNPQSPVTSEHLAYVIFTSGSTGVPKGTMIEHRQLYNYIHGISERLSLSPGMSYATVSTIAGDLGNTCIYPALTGGGTLHVIAQDRVYDPDAFAAYMHEH